MSMSQWMAYSLVKDCLKEALYADWRNDPEKSRHYLALAKVRLLELRHGTKQGFVAWMAGQERSPHLHKPVLRETLRSTFQYAHAIRQCKKPPRPH